MNYKKIKYKGHEIKHKHINNCSCCHEHHEHIEKHINLNEENTFSFYIKGLDCANCAQKLENTFKLLNIIEEVNLNFASEILTLKTKEKINQEKLLKILQEETNKIEDNVIISISKNNINSIKLFKVKENIPLLIGIFIYILTLILNINFLNIPLFLISYLLIGYKILLKAGKNIMNGDIFDENFLMCIATIGAFLIKNYSEAIAVLIFYSIGEIFQSYAVNKSRKSISDLMNIKTEIAHIKKDNRIKDISPEEINIGDILVIKIGEKIPVDGIITKGKTTLDISSLTGESIPIFIKENERVLSGSINLTEIIEIKTTKKYQDSTVAQILNLIENSSSKKSITENFITKFAKIYTPIVCILALLITIIPPILNPSLNFNDCLYKALTFLVISCPCALVISIPLALYAGIGKASKSGIMIKGSNFLEELKNINSFAFDKTGTLTKGDFEIISINGPDNLLEIAAYGEYFSNHPIAKSILNKYSNKIDETKISNFKEMTGKGIIVETDGKLVILGNKELLENNNINIKETNDIGTIIHIAVDNIYQGYIVIADTIKESTKEGINFLKNKHNKKCVMLTGDSEEIAKTISTKLNLDDYYSNLLPQDKVSKIEELLKTQKIAYIGDGINDAPVLARSNIGIAMGTKGQDAAIEAADIIIMNDDIRNISKAIEISEKTNLIMRQNIIFILAIKTIFLILTALGFTNMWMGVFADVGVALITILNSVRIIK